MQSIHGYTPYFKVFNSTEVYTPKEVRLDFHLIVAPSKLKVYGGLNEPQDPSCCVYHNSPPEWDYSVFDIRNQPLLHCLQLVSWTMQTTANLLIILVKERIENELLMHLPPSNTVQGWNPRSSVKSWKICIQSDTIASDSLHMGLWSR